MALIRGGKWSMHDTPSSTPPSDTPTDHWLRPAWLSVRPDSIPQQLRFVPHWVCWRAQLRDRKWTKVPYDPQSGRRARINDPTTWSAFAVVLGAYKKRAEVAHYDGISYAITAEDRLCGVDLDHCRD